MKIVHTSDWHIGKFINEYNMIEDQKYYIDKFIKYIKSEKIELVIIAGDIYHRTIPSIEAINLVNEAFSKMINELNIPIIVISGNHDSRERLGFGKKLFENSNLYIKTSIEDIFNKISLKDEYGIINFYTIPYIEPNYIKKLYKEENIITFDDSMKLLISKIKENINLNERNILITHGFFSYIKNNNEDNKIIFSESEISIGGSDMVDAKIFEIFDYVALGHLHAPQKIGKETIRYSGSILKYSLSETNQKKSITIIDLKEKSNIKIYKKHINPKRDLKIIQGDFYELIDANNISELYSEDYIFVNITSNKNILDPVNKLKNVFPNILGIKFIKYDKENMKIKNEFSDNKIKSKSIHELFKDFYSYVTKNKISEEAEKVILEISNNVKEEFI